MIYPTITYETCIMIHQIDKIRVWRNYPIVLKSADRKHPVLHAPGTAISTVLNEVPYYHDVEANEVSANPPLLCFNLTIFRPGTGYCNMRGGLSFGPRILDLIGDSHPGHGTRLVRERHNTADHQNCDVSQLHIQTSPTQNNGIPEREH